MEKFSILTSSYNNAQYLKDWQGSILRQNYRPLEVVLVNDCCTDETDSLIPQIAETFAKADIGFKYVKNAERMYYGSCCRIAWQNASGDYYGFLDSDDMLADKSVEYIVDLYKKYPDVVYIYTQFASYKTDYSMVKGVGFSKAPKKGESLLSMGKKGQHTFSHWRTFSKACPKTYKIFKDGLRCAVDKYLGYRLEELGPGMFANRVCYLYRTGVPGQISKVEKSIRTWKTLMLEAEQRRLRYSVKPFPIRTHDEG